MSRWAALAVALAGLAVSFQHASAQLAERKVLTLAAAQRMVAAARAEAERRHLTGVIAVVDDGGWPILILRMDNSADIASVELAPGKARTTALFKKPSGAQEQTINNGRFAAVARDFIVRRPSADGVVLGRRLATASL
jgi:glc operon protein GlcG